MIVNIAQIDRQIKCVGSSIIICFEGTVENEWVRRKGSKGMGEEEWARRNGWDRMDEREWMRKKG
jgi:hypothetical protein